MCSSDQVYEGFVSVSRWRRSPVSHLSYSRVENGAWGRSEEMYVESWQTKLRGVKFFWFYKTTCQTVTAKILGVIGQTEYRSTFWVLTELSMTLTNTCCQVETVECLLSKSHSLTLWLLSTWVFHHYGIFMVIFMYKTVFLLSQRKNFLIIGWEQIVLGVSCLYAKLTCLSNQNKSCNNLMI